MARPLAQIRQVSNRFDRNIWLLLGNTFFVFLGLGIFMLVFNLYLTALGYEEDFVGLFSFASTAAIGAFAIPAGAISNRFGPRACLAAASVLMGVSGLAITLFANPIFVVAVGVVYGISNALIFVPSGPFLVDHTGEDERLQAFSVNFAVMSSAQMIGSLASGYLPGIFAASLALSAASPLAYRLTLVVGAAASLIGVVPMLFARSGDHRRPNRSSTTPTRPPLEANVARRALLAFAGSTFLIALATGLILPFFNVYFEKELGASVELIGIIFAVASLLMIPASLFGPLLAKRIGTVNSVTVFRMITAPFILSLAFFPSLALGAVAYIGRAGFISVTWPLDNAFAMTLMPARWRATQAGVRSTAWNVGWSLASLVAGQLIVTVGYPIIFIGSGLLTVAGTVFYHLNFRRYDDRAPVREPANAEAPASSLD